MTTAIETPVNTPTGGGDDTELWGRQVDLAGVEYFSIVVDPIDAKEEFEGGIAEMMTVPADKLGEILFSSMGEELWFKPYYVLWGPSIADYDDDEPVVGVRCTMIGYR